MENPFDQPLVQSVLLQRDLAMNNWALQAARVRELEVEVATLKRQVPSRVSEDRDCG